LLVQNFMSSLTQPRVAFQSVQPNVPRASIDKAIPVARTQFVLDAASYKSRKCFTYTISDLLSFRKDAVPYTLPLEAELALNEKSEVPYQTPIKRYTKEESDPHRLESRTKQVTYGKVTDGYKNYVKFVPVERRMRGDPKTPDIHQTCSKRSWDGQVRKWRRALHAFDEITDESQLVEVRKNLVTINQTPNKKGCATEPIQRKSYDRHLKYRALTFDNLE